MRYLARTYLYHFAVVLIAFFPCFATAQTDFWQQTNGPYGGRENWDEINIGHGVPSEIVINDRGHIFVSFWRGGIIRSRDNGETWEEINEGFSRESSPGNQFDIDQILTLAVDPENHLLAGSYGCGIFHSTDNGESWIPMNNGLFDLGVQAFTFTNEGAIIAGSVGSGVFRSSNKGATWEQVNTTPGVETLTINSTGHIFAGTFRDGILRSLNNGSTWQAINNGIENLEDSSIDYYIIFGLTTKSPNLIFAATDAGVYRSIDNGRIWTKANNGLKEYAWAASMTVDNEGNIYTLSSENVYVSEDDGDHWIALESGLENVPAVAITISKGGVLFAGTRDNGVFRFGEPTIAESSPIPTLFSLAQNYPNPFNASTTIRFEVPNNAGAFEVSIYNIQGQLITHLFEGTAPAGQLELRWDGRDAVGQSVASGVYVYALKAGNGLERCTGS